MAKILGICGSPRKGATEYAVLEALKEAETIPGIETEYWSVRGKKISPCVHCDACIRKETMCIIKDDIQELEQKILEADGIIVGSPVYDMNITAQLTAVFNRLRPMYLVHPGKLQNKVGAAITTGGTRYGGQELTKLPIINFFLMHEMLVSGGLGGCYIGGTIWSKDGKAKGAQEDETGMDTVKRLGKGAAEAVMVSKFGLEKWNLVKEELDVKKDEKSPLRDH
ncbi:MULTISPECIES: flavodoxin family protein [unclassified Clostridioides]|uniref:flavodoxin family protein n=1 Tax=unclassified Clostridioides TaxID=2635829 RepID=UPI001D0C9240|nr:flavodoxin family protein [Clostridioides sp. ES-S-0001-02]MCC0638737.1 flavodoxin family protein [Clostridioides sp. ES-S-0049-03]MCC0652428.1 flavodoxin family protein [Clostridioides sp. ES-S-0001-03]MCC0655099.1 flavodoxin family protein [Clostridioides sp. ES-S-0123-01]MCC0673477.1 flavodoxin family protein [Clostridioides sp. ES-S-0145-01]MCC0675125.1 flavodoxin family protein [Clostridioides sp. ES-W-0018-02]MCC0679736.1 flavodoxin family protein [Clostridioides sp. ES-S-0005-03]MC